VVSKLPPLSWPYVQEVSPDTTAAEASPDAAAPVASAPEGDQDGKKKKRKKKKKKPKKGQAQPPTEGEGALPPTGDAGPAPGEAIDLPAWSREALQGTMLHPLLLQNLQRQGFVNPTPIQRLTLPLATQGGPQVSGWGGLFLAPGGSGELGTVTGVIGRSRSRVVTSLFRRDLVQAKLTRRAGRVTGGT
jgi:hypothetical protein